MTELKSMDFHSMFFSFYLLKKVMTAFEFQNNFNFSFSSIEPETESTVHLIWSSLPAIQNEELTLSTDIQIETMKLYDDYYHWSHLVLDRTTNITKQKCLYNLNLNHQHHQYNTRESSFMQKCLFSHKTTNENGLHRASNEMHILQRFQHNSKHRTQNQEPRPYQVYPKRTPNIAKKLSFKILVMFLLISYFLPKLYLMFCIFFIASALRVLPANETRTHTFASRTEPNRLKQYAQQPQHNKL